MSDAPQTRPPKPGQVLSAPYVLEYAYRRSLGPVMSAFFTALRDGPQILGAKTRSGRVLVPPREYDPDGAAPIGELVPVGEVGEVTSWAWVYEPRPKHPLQRPFAWALVRLDGADSALLHAVDAGNIERMQTGMRVRARWRDERVGQILDIACFEPVTVADTGSTDGDSGDQGVAHE